VQLLFPSTRLDFKVSGILSNFPTGQGNFIVIDRAALLQYIDLEASQYARWKEVWLRIDPGFYGLLESMPWVRDGLRADSRQEQLELEANPFLQGTRRAFALNSVIVSILSVAGLFLVHYFSARQRTYEFGVLRAEGMSAGQVLLLLAGEALLSALIGLGVGVLLGLGLSEGMRAYLNLILGRVEGGLVLYQVRADWLSVLRQAGLLVGGYLLATLISLGMLMRSGVHRVLRIGDE
jgi:putative ABC transport system permease protein